MGNDNTINISQRYFIKHFVERLREINKKLNEVDNVLISKEDLNLEWTKVREVNLEIDEFIDALT